LGTLVDVGLPRLGFGIFLERFHLGPLLGFFLGLKTCRALAVVLAQPIAEAAVLAVAVPYEDRE
jgi:galactitol-specific phosphotransferase system IIC component